MTDNGKVLILTSSLLTDRMILYGGLLPRLGEHHDVEVWAVSARHEKFASAWREAPACVRALPDVRPFREAHNYLRRFNEFAWHSRYGSYAHISRHKRAQANGEKLRFRVMRKVGAAAATLRLERAIEWTVERVTREYDRSPLSSEWLRQHSPSLIVSTGPHRFEEPGVVARAAKLGIPVMALITSWDNLSTANNRMLTRYDGFLVWSEQMKRELHHFYPYSRTRPVYVIGAPQFDVFGQERFNIDRVSFCSAQGLDPERKIVLYALGSPNLIPGEWHAALHLAQRISAGDLGAAQLVVRPHPLFDDGVLQEHFARSGSHVIVQRTGQPGLPVGERFQGDDQVREWVNSFRHADVVVNLSSTATIDAALCDRPIVNLDFDPSPNGTNADFIYEINHLWMHFRPINESGGVWLVRDKEELVSAIQTYLSRPDLHRKERRDILEHVCQYADGRSGERLADAINEFMMGACQVRKVS